MITRIIYEDSKVYYRLKDLKKLFDCSDYKIKKAIKIANIETHKLDFGRTLFVKEEDICRLDINNYKCSMRTTFKDLHDEIKSHYGMNQLLDKMFPAIKKSEVELQNKAIEDANNSLDSVNRESRRVEADDYMQVFNNVAQELGFAERIHKVRMLCNNEDVINEFMLINKNGDIIAEAGYHSFTIESFEESIREGRFVTNTEENIYIELKKGNPHKVKNENELLEKLHNLAVNSEYEKSTVDYSYMTLPNGEDYSISIEFLHAIYFDRLVILKDDLEEQLLQALNSQSVDEIIDVEYIEVLENDGFDDLFAPLEEDMVKNKIDEYKENYVTVDYVNMNNEQIDYNKFQSNDFIEEERERLLALAEKSRGKVLDSYLQQLEILENVVYVQ